MAKEETSKFHFFSCCLNILQYLMFFLIIIIYNCEYKSIHNDFMVIKIYFLYLGTLHSIFFLWKYGELLQSKMVTLFAT